MQLSVVRLGLSHSSPISPKLAKSLKDDTSTVMYMFIALFQVGEEYSKLVPIFPESVTHLVGRCLFLLFASQNSRNHTETVH